MAGRGEREGGVPYLSIRNPPPPPSPRPSPQRGGGACRPGSAQNMGRRVRHDSWQHPDSASSPHFLGQLDDHRELRPLLVLGQDIALLGRGKAALRREAELVEIGIFRRLLDPPFDVVLLLQRAALRGDEADRKSTRLNSS